MSTKINTRSPFYLTYGEPSLPSVALDCNLVNGTEFAVDQFGNISPPLIDYGSIDSYTSSDSDFADGKFATVSVATSRTVSFDIIIPSNFSNASDEILTCSFTATQPVFTCTGGVTTNGSIPNQSLDTGGDSVELTLSSYFTAGTDPIQEYVVTNLSPSFVSTYIDAGELYIFSGSKAGSLNILVEARDGNELTCNATQNINITITAAQAYDCSFSYLSGGGISNTGTITNPNSNGTITAISETESGPTITSYSANNTGSSREVTLYFHITVPSGQGFTNAGNTVKCPKTFTQSSTTLPEFTCEVAGLSGQAVANNGAIKIGTANKGTIASFSPLSFSGDVTSDTPRTITFQITPPASGYSNSGGANIPCEVTVDQPAPVPGKDGLIAWYIAPYDYYYYLTNDQWTGAGLDTSPTGDDRQFLGGLLQYRLENFAKQNAGIDLRVVLFSSNILDNIGSSMRTAQYSVSYVNLTTYHNGFTFGKENNPNREKAIYVPLSPVRRFVNQYQAENRDKTWSYIETNYQPLYYVRYEVTDRISEIWNVDHVDRVFTRLA